MTDELTKASFTNLEKVIYPELGLKKSGVIKYYIEIAPKMLGFLKNRAIVMNRYPDGIGREGFYGIGALTGMPAWVKTFKRYSDSTAGHKLCCMQ